jgi:DNA ligase (NAD+)
MYEDLFIDNKYLKLKAKEIVAILINMDKYYHEEGNPVIPDSHYDLLKDHLRKISPKNAYFKQVGFKPQDNMKVKLPYYLGSQDKIKYEDVKELNKWLLKYNKPKEYCISEKLDGISCLIVNNSKGECKIYTRGDGYNGTDISHIRNYLPSIPSKIPKEFAVRGELVLSKKNWEKIKDKGVNPRNLVAGIINRKTIDKKILSLIDFVAYELLSEEMSAHSSRKFIENLGFKIVQHDLIKNTLTNDELLDYLKLFKSKSNYEIDGIVITHNKYYKLKEGKNPEYSFAFKSNLLLEEAEVIVNDVEWNISKDKYLKPIVKFTPVNINGVSIKQATGFNADFIVKNKIGVGSIIKIQRSGDVIPHIIAVLKPSDNNEPLMPKMPYKWNKTKIDIIVDSDEKNREQDIKAFTFFMKSLQIKGVSEGIIAKLYDNSYDTIKKIINIKKEDLLNINGFKDKSADNIINALSIIKTKQCIDIMIASNIIGRGLGERKLLPILDKYPFICNDKTKALKLTVDDIKTVDGIGDVLAIQFIEKLQNFYDFYEEIGMKMKINKDTVKKQKVNINKNFENKHFCFSGFRNKTFEDYIKTNNGFVDDTIKSTTNYLIVKDKTKITNKIKTAIEKGIILLSMEEFEALMV